MDSNPSAPEGRAQTIDQDWLEREIWSLRTYLAFMAENKQMQGASDLVDSVLIDAVNKVRDGDSGFKFQSPEALRVWLVKRVEWKYLDLIRRRERHDRLLSDLPPRPAPPSP